MENHQRGSPSQATAIAVVQRDVEALTKLVEGEKSERTKDRDEMEKLIRDELAKLVSKIEFWPYKMIVLTMAGSILAAFLGALITGVFRGGHIQ